MYQPDGSLYKEELVSSKGFSGIYSNKYHLNMPTRTIKLSEIEQIDYNEWNEAPLDTHHFYTENWSERGTSSLPEVLFD